MNIRLSLKENFNDKKNKEHVALMVILSAFFTNKRNFSDKEEL